MLKWVVCLVPLAVQLTCNQGILHRVLRIRHWLIVASLLLCQLLWPKKDNNAGFIACKYCENDIMQKITDESDLKVIGYSGNTKLQQYWSSLILKGPHLWCPQQGYSSYNTLYSSYSELPRQWRPRVYISLGRLLCEPCPGLSMYATSNRDFLSRISLATLNISQREKLTEKLLLHLILIMS